MRYHLGLRIDTIRARGKAVFRRFPRAYPYAKAVFIQTKLVLDRAVFRMNNPRAEYVLYSEKQLRELRAVGYSSQYGQDYYLASSVFPGQSTGFFIDIGGNHPVELSNSYFLEQSGWSGVAFDPLSKMEDLWAAYRTAAFHRTAIGPHLGTRQFVEIQPRDGWEHTLSGFKEHVRDEDVAMFGAREYDVPIGPLGRYTSQEQNVDLLMIDVEGAELVVLEGSDLDVTKPSIVLVENVSAVGGGRAIRRYMDEHGYQLIARIGAADDVYRRSASLG